MFLFKSAPVSEAHAMLRDALKEMKSRPTHENIENFVFTYGLNFEELPEQELLNSGIEKDAITAFTTLASFVCLKLSESEFALKSLSSLALFIPQKGALDGVPYRLFTAMLDNILYIPHEEAATIMKRLTYNQYFCEQLMKEENLIPSFKKALDLPIWAGLFVFGTFIQAIYKANNVNARSHKKFITLLSSAFKQLPPYALQFFGIFYRKIGKNRELERLLTYLPEKCASFAECSAYFEIAEVETFEPLAIPTSFEEFVKIAPSELAVQILNIYKKYPVYRGSLIFYGRFLRNLSEDMQIVYLDVLMTLERSKMEELMSLLIPPWDFGVGAAVLARFFEKHCSERQATNYLTRTLIFPDFILIKEKFNGEEGIPNFLIALLGYLDEGSFRGDYVFRLSELLVDGVASASLPLVYILQNATPATYVDSLISGLSKFSTSMLFKAILSDIIRQTSPLRLVLVSKSFAKISIDFGMFECLSAVSMDGPIPQIDKEVTEAIGLGKFEGVSEEHIARIARSQPLNSETIRGSITIPSLIPLLTTFNELSLSDRYIIGKYLSENDLLSFENPLFVSLSVQYIPIGKIYHLIDHPMALKDITAPCYPHQSVYQFSEGREQSFISILRDTTIEFRVDEFKKPFVLLMIGHQKIECVGTSLVFETERIPIVPNEWNKLSIVIREDRVKIIVCEKYKKMIKFDKNSNSGVTIGSRFLFPGSVFYVKKDIKTSKGEYQYQLGPGVIDVDYEGIYYHLSETNLVSRIYQSIMETKSSHVMNALISTLINISLVKSESLSPLLKRLRVIFIEKADIIDEASFSIISLMMANETTFEYYMSFFNEYSLWEKILEVETYALPLFANIFGNIRYEIIPAELEALFFFLMDLSYHIGIESEMLSNIIVLLFKKLPKKEDAVRSFVLQSEPSNALITLISENVHLLRSIPTNMVQYLPLVFLDMLYNYEIKQDKPSTDTILEVVKANTSIVFTYSFWLTMFEFLSGRKLNQVGEYGVSSVIRPEFIKVILFSTKYLYPKEKDLLCEVLITVESISRVNKVDLSVFVDDMRHLLNLGQLSDESVLESSTYAIVISIITETISNCKFENQEDVLHKLLFPVSSVDDDFAKKVHTTLLNALVNKQETTKELEEVMSISQLAGWWKPVQSELSKTEETSEVDEIEDQKVALNEEEDNTGSEKVDTEELIENESEISIVEPENVGYANDLIQEWRKESDPVLPTKPETGFEDRFDSASEETEKAAFDIFCLLPPYTPSEWRIAPPSMPGHSPMLIVPSPPLSSLEPRPETPFKIGNRIATIRRQYGNLPSFTARPFFSTRLNKPPRSVDCMLVVASRKIGCYLEPGDTNRLIIYDAPDSPAVRMLLTCFLQGDFPSRTLIRGNPVIYIPSDSTAYPKRFCQADNSLEVFPEAGYPIFIIFSSKDNRDTALSFFKHGKYPSLSTFTSAYINDVISPSEYLLALNFLSDRTFSNTSQHPVFPWSIERNYTLSVGMQDEIRARDFLSKYEESYPDSHFFGSFYTSPAIVAHLLLRTQPFFSQHLDIHAGMDHRDRLFRSMTREWQTAGHESPHNVHELAPEMFYIHEVYENSNKLPIPPPSVQNYSQRVIDGGVDLYEGVSTPEGNMIKMRQGLDNPDFHFWIDLIFGYQSRGDAAYEAKNLFYPAVYGIVPVLLGPDAMESLTLCFGQAPTQIFTSPHPVRQIVRKTLVTAKSLAGQIVYPSTTKELTVIVGRGGKMSFPGETFGFWPGHDILEDIVSTVCTRRKIAIVSSGCECALFHTGTGRFIREFTSLKPPKEIKVEKTYGTIVMCSDSFIEAYSISGQLEGTYVPSTPIRAFAVSNDGICTIICTVSSDGLLIVYKMTDNGIEYVRDTHTSIINAESVKIERRALGVVINGVSEGYIVSPRESGEPIEKRAKPKKCGQCQVECKEFHTCVSCGLGYCSECSRVYGKVYCSECLETIETLDAM